MAAKEPAHDLPVVTTNYDYTLTIKAQPPEAISGWKIHFFDETQVNNEFVLGTLGGDSH